MSKLRCPCGHIIPDVTDFLPYKGYIIPDKNLEEISSAMTDAIDELQEIKTEHEHVNWIRSHFGKGHPEDLKASSVIHDIVLGPVSRSMRHIYQCENCSRILIQEGKTNQFRSFSPDEPGSGNLLDSTT